MKLAAAARRFDRQVLTDAYGTDTILGQFDLFDDSKRDGTTGRRRVLSVAPDVIMPARNALSIDGMTWIAGTGNTDYFNADPIRRKYVMHEADGLATIQTFAQLLSAAAGTSAYVALEWVKAAKEIDESSDLTDVLTAVFARSESIPNPSVVTLGSESYLLREPHQSAAGFQVVLADEIKAPVTEIGSFTGKTYDPVNDLMTGTAANVKFLRMRWQSHFKYLSSRTLAYQPGDDVLICLKSAATPKANDSIVLSDGTWQVVTVQSEDASCWNIHARRISG